jgi:hypothetical protein
MTPCGNCSEQVAQAIAGRKCVLFAGAGVSRDGGLPDWLDMARRLKDALVEQAKLPTKYVEFVTTLLETKDNLPLALEIILGVVPRKDVAKALRTILTPSKDSKVGEIIAKLGLHGVVTTNYDRLLDSVVSPQSYRLTNSLDNLELVPTAVSYGGQFLLKLHGDIDDELEPSHPQVARGAPFMVLCRGDYAALVQGKRGERLMFALHSILQDNSVLFLGYSFSDPDVNWLLQYLGENYQFSHSSWYIALRGEALPPLPSNVAGIRALDTWDDLPRWLLSLLHLTRRSQGLKSEPKVPVHAATPSDRERRAFLAVGQYLKDLESADLAERVLACALLDDIATQPTLPRAWLGQRIALLLDVGPQFATALAAATVRYLVSLGILEPLEDGDLRVNSSAIETLRNRGRAEWNGDRDRFYGSVGQRLGAPTVPVRPDFQAQLDRLLHDLCINFGESMAAWVHRGIGEEFSSQHAQELIAQYFPDRDDSRRAGAVLRLIFDNPSDDEVLYLYRLLGAAFLANSVRLEPSASKVLESTLASYELYLDSNVLLPLLIDEVHDHRSITTIIQQSKDAGVSLFVWRDMLNEVEAHRDLADGIVRDCHGNIGKLVTLVEVLDKRANCFLQGYLNILTVPELADAKADVRHASVPWEAYLDAYKFANLLDKLDDVGIKVIAAEDGPVVDPDYKQVLSAIADEWKKRRHGDERPPVLNENEARLFCHIYRRRSQLAAEARPVEVWFLSYETVLEKVFQRNPGRWGMPPTFPFAAWVAFLDARLPWVHKDPGAIVRAILIGYSSAFDLPDPVALVRKKAFGDRVPTHVEEEALQLAASGFQIMKAVERARSAILARSNLAAATRKSGEAMSTVTGEISATLAQDIERLHEQLARQQARAEEAEAKLRQQQRHTSGPAKPRPKSGASAPAQRQPGGRNPRPARRRRR